MRRTGLNLKGQVFSRLTVMLLSHIDKFRFWECRCSCGNVTIVSSNSLRTGNTKSCGCLRRDFSKTKHRTHGMSSSKIYYIWQAMIARCYNKNNKSFKYYGERGIKVCKRWWVFENFYADMGNKPDGRSIDRIRNNEKYEPSNCRWATKIEQMNNTRIINNANKSY